MVALFGFAFFNSVFLNLLRESQGKSGILIFLLLGFRVFHGPWIHLQGGGGAVLAAAHILPEYFALQPLLPLFDVVGVGRDPAAALGERPRGLF